MILHTEDIIKLLLALFLGGLIGFEREMRDKTAGFRTLMFISTGSALLTIFSMRMAQLPGFAAGDPARIAAQIVSGIGFLGAGAILRDRGEIRGLTTAATIWLAAALGIGAGAGEYLFSATAAGIILLALLLFPALEGHIGTLNQTRTYEIISPARLEIFERLKELFRSRHLALQHVRRSRSGEDMICRFVVSGRPSNHEAAVNDLFADAEIKSFDS
jgi:putative Mg2+ transporter-C (MgtC) family protein